MSDGYSIEEAMEKDFLRKKLKCFNANIGNTVNDLSDCS